MLFRVWCNAKWFPGNVGYGQPGAVIKFVFFLDAKISQISGYF